MKLLTRIKKHYANVHPRHYAALGAVTLLKKHLSTPEKQKWLVRSQEIRHTPYARERDADRAWYRLDIRIAREHDEALA